MDLHLSRHFYSLLFCGFSLDIRPIHLLRQSSHLGFVPLRLFRRGRLGETSLFHILGQEINIPSMYFFLLGESVSA